MAYMSLWELYFWWLTELVLTEITTLPLIILGLLQLLGIDILLMSSGFFCSFLFIGRGETDE